MPRCTASPRVSRRRLLCGLAAGTTGLLAGSLTGGAAAAPLSTVALDKATRDAMRPQQVLQWLLAGNQRFRSGKPRAHPLLAQKAATRDAQHPAAVILSCIDSRAPVELVLDTGIGDVFSARVAGNLVSADMLGSMEFACAVAGAKLVLVMGHTGCGAIKGAIAGAGLGHLAQMTERLRSAAEATPYAGVRAETDAGFVTAVTRTHVAMSVQQIRMQSSALAGLERTGAIALAGALYHLDTGQVELLPPWAERAGAHHSALSLSPAAYAVGA